MPRMPYVSLPYLDGGQRRAISHNAKIGTMECIRIVCLVAEGSHWIARLLRLRMYVMAPYTFSFTGLPSISGPVPGQEPIYRHISSGDRSVGDLR